MFAPRAEVQQNSDSDRQTLVMHNRTLSVFIGPRRWVMYRKRHAVKPLPVEDRADTDGSWVSLDQDNDANIGCQERSSSQDKSCWSDRFVLNSCSATTRVNPALMLPM